MAAWEAVLFDAYGTLLDVHTAIARHAARVGSNWRQVSADWRAKQLEYTWVRSLTGAAMHEDFYLCTRDALDVVFAKHGIDDVVLKKDLMQAYMTLDAFPEVPEVLKAIRAMGVPVVILSNGTPGMLRSALEAAGIASLIDETLSVEEIGVFKPDRRVYNLAIRQFGCDPEDMVYVSSNAWDAQAALYFGFRTIRVNRTGEPDEYQLLPNGATEIRDLAVLPQLLA